MRVDLGEVDVELAVVPVAFDELLLDERLEMLLDIRGRGDEPRGQLLGHLLNHAVVVQLSPSLHDADNGGFNLRLAVLLDAGAGLLLLGLRLTLRADRRDLHLHHLGRELVVDAEHVVVVHVLAHRLLPQDVFAANARERLQRSAQVIARDLSRRLDVAVAQTLRVVEQHEYAGHVRAHAQLAPHPIPERGPHIRRAHLREKRQATPVVAAQVKVPVRVARRLHARG